MNDTRNAPQAWSPSVYLKFENERTRPARDLLAQVPVAAPRRVVDVGCGPGNSTELLSARWPDAEIVGFDSSEAMLAEARKRLPSATFVHADASTWLPEPGTDVVFANAVYQWIPQHIESFARVLQSLESGAVLAVQMPDNLMQPMHVLMREVAANAPFAAKLEGAARAPLPPVGTYYDALAPCARRIDIWHAIYVHVLGGPADIVEWVKGTGLNPFLQRLDATEQEAFLATYLEAVTVAYPRQADGKVLMPFNRLFLVAER
jgi:trans-aconitate 2-methyltransferase